MRTACKQSAASGPMFASARARRSIFEQIRERGSGSGLTEAAPCGRDDLPDGGQARIDALAYKQILQRLALQDVGAQGEPFRSLLAAGPETRAEIALAIGLAMGLISPSLVTQDEVRGIEERFGPMATEVALETCSPTDEPQLILPDVEQARRNGWSALLAWIEERNPEAARWLGRLAPGDTEEEELIAESGSAIPIIERVVYLGLKLRT